MCEVDPLKFQIAPSMLQTTELFPKSFENSRTFCEGLTELYNLVFTNFENEATKFTHVAIH